MKPDQSAPARPERTPFSFKDPVPDTKPASTGVEVAVAPFWNTEKVLISCSRRITYR
jgi:ribosome biogenesis protein BRX1